MERFSASRARATSGVLLTPVSANYADLAGGHGCPGCSARHLADRHFVSWMDVLRRLPAL